jgi:hypothetical protein
MPWEDGHIALRVSPGGARQRSNRHVYEVASVLTYFGIGLRKGGVLLTCGDGDETVGTIEALELRGEARVEDTHITGYTASKTAAALCPYHRCKRCWNCALTWSKTPFASYCLLASMFCARVWTHST